MRLAMTMFITMPPMAANLTRTGKMASSGAEWVTFLIRTINISSRTACLFIELQRRYKADLVSTKVELTAVYLEPIMGTPKEADFRLYIQSSRSSELCPHNREATASACGKLPSQVAD